MEMTTIVSELIVNKSTLRYEKVNGREFAIAPITIYRPRVLTGSKGAKYYPKEEIEKVAEEWNGRPMVVYHPMKGGKNVSAGHPDIFKKQEIGRVYESQVGKDGSNTVEGWFDVELTKLVDSRIWTALQEGNKIEVSTGLYTDDEDAPLNSQIDGVPYSQIARNYRPNHLAILPDEIGACSLKDGCGVFNKDSSIDSSITQTNNQSLSQENTMNEKANLIQWLTTNCTCYKSAESKSKLEALTDNALKEIILENAEKAVEADPDKSFLDWIGNADKEIRGAILTMVKRKLKTAVGGNEFPAKKEATTTPTKETTPPPPAAQLTPEEEEAKKRAEEEAKVAAAQNQTTNRVQPVMTQEQFFQIFPFMKDIVSNSQQLTNNEKNSLVHRLTCNITDNNQKQQITNELMKKDISDLRLMASLITMQPNQQTVNSLPYSQPINNFFGMNGGPSEITDNKYLQEEKLEFSGYDWNEIAKASR